MKKLTFCLLVTLTFTLISCNKKEVTISLNDCTMESPISDYFEIDGDKAEISYVEPGLFYEEGWTEDEKEIDRSLLDVDRSFFILKMPMKLKKTASEDGTQPYNIYSNMNAQLTDDLGNKSKFQTSQVKSKFPKKYEQYEKFITSAPGTQDTVWFIYNASIPHNISIEDNRKRGKEILDRLADTKSITISKM